MWLHTFLTTRILFQLGKKRITKERCKINNPIKTVVKISNNGKQNKESM
jgi:hypothetical protein